MLQAVGAGYEGPLRTPRRALAERFSFWRGASGQRYVCSVYPPASVPPYAPSVALHVRRGPFGPAVLAVTAGSDPLPASDEVHLHLVRGDAEALALAIQDLAALVAPLRPVIVTRRAA